MSSIKFVHVIKHLEIIDRDISELRHFEEILVNDRTYSDNIRISLELQINSLLNERVKLMELTIENPPPSLQKMKNNQRNYLSQKKPFNFGEHEQYYLPRLLAQSDTSQTKRMIAPILERRDYAPKITQTTTEHRTQPAISLKKKDEPSQKSFDASVASLISKKSFPTSAREDNNDIKSDIKGFLKNLPTLDY